MWNLDEDATFHIVLPYDAKAFEEEFATLSAAALLSGQADSVPPSPREHSRECKPGEVALRRFCLDKERCRIYLVVVATDVGKEKDRMRKSLPASTVTGQTISILSASWQEFYSQVTFVAQLSAHNVDTTSLAPSLLNDQHSSRLLFSLETTVGLERDGDGALVGPAEFQLRIKCFHPPDSVTIWRKPSKTQKRDSIKETEQARYRFPAYDPMLLSVERAQMESMTSIFALEQRLDESGAQEERMGTVVVEKGFNVLEVISVEVSVSKVKSAVYLHCKVDNMSRDIGLEVKDVSFLDRTAQEQFEVTAEGCVDFPIALDAEERCGFLFVITRKEEEDGLDDIFRSSVCVKWACPMLNREQDCVREVEWSWKDTRRKGSLCCTIAKTSTSGAYKLRTPFTVALNIENRTDQEVDLEVLQTLHSSNLVPMALYLRIGKVGAGKRKAIPLSYRPLSTGLHELGEGVVVRDRLEQTTKPLDNRLALYVSV